MQRVDLSGTIHFNGFNGHTLCGCVTTESDMFGKPIQLAKKTSDQVTCTDCATLYCRIKNAPWHEVNDTAMERGIYDAVKEEQ